MGLFSFLKKKDSNVSYQDPIEEVVETPSRKTIDDFFSLNICDLKQFTKDATDMGRYKLGVKILPDDMGLFHSAVIREFTDGSFNVEFKSDKAVITKDLSDFISICVEQFGPDKSGASHLSDKDFLFLRSGLFSRRWDQVCIDMETNDEDIKVINLVLFNPKQQ